MSIATAAHGRIPEITLPYRLRIARETAGLEQAEVADVLGTGRSTISNYERGVTVPGKLALNAWAVACDVDVEWLKTGALPQHSPVGPAGIEPTHSTV